MLNLASLLKDSARKHPTRNAVVLGEIRLDCAGLDALANQAANRLDSRGIEPGDKVALPCPNVPDLPATYDGILKSGAVVVPLNVLLKSRERWRPQVPPDRRARGHPADDLDRQALQARAGGVVIAPLLDRLDRFFLENPVLIGAFIGVDLATLHRMSVASRGPGKQS
jgi:AMP-binding enzyme